MGSQNLWGCGFMLTYLLLAAPIFVSSQDDTYDELVNDDGHAFNYDQQGRNWGGTCSSGQSQSPIALYRVKAINKSIPPISFHGYDQPLESPLVLINNGHSANMVLPPTRDGQRASISGGLLPGDYDAQSVHFHWGSFIRGGSEHTINNKRYDVEMHIVHKNLKYANISVGEASQYPDGLAVLGVMLRSVPVNLRDTSGLDKIFNQLPQITAYDTSSEIDGDLAVGDLLGNLSTNKFFSYNGSLTTPDCAESVTWTVFQDSIELNSKQVQKLFNLKDSRERPLIRNFRSLQNLNNRPVYFRAR